VIDFDPTRTYADLEVRLASTESPRQRTLIEAVIAHGKAEAARDLDGLMATLVEEPMYHFWVGQRDVGPKGYSSVRAYYQQFVLSGGAVFESPKHRIVVDDNSVVHEGIITTLASGRIAKARGYDVDDLEAHYALRMRNTVLWSFDERALAFGEDSYTVIAPEDFEKIADDQLPTVYVDYLAEIGHDV